MSYCSQSIIINFYLNLFIIILFCKIKFSITTDQYFTSPSSPFEQPYCSFFSNRAPSPQPGLSNCTWFNKNSCCRDNEMQLIFSQVRPLIGSSPLCTRFLNVLMCYICSPEQHRFYRSERLHVCRSYCDNMYRACGSALMKGTPIQQLYSDGTEFCLSRRFEVHHNEVVSEKTNYTATSQQSQGKREEMIACFNDNVDDASVLGRSSFIERPSFVKIFIVIIIAAMLSFLIC